MANLVLLLTDCQQEDLIATRAQLVMCKRIAVDNDMSIRFEIGSDQFYPGIKKELHREFRCGLCFNDRVVNIPKEIKLLGHVEGIMIPGKLVMPCPECSG